MKDQQKSDHTKQGFIALVTVLVIGVVLVTIGYSVSLLSISEGQLAQSEKRNEAVLDLTEACVEDALLRLNNTNALTTTVILPEGTCTLTIDSTVGTTWTFTVSGSFQTLVKKIQVVATRGSTITVNSWLETL